MTNVMIATMRYQRMKRKTQSSMAYAASPSPLGQSIETFLLGILLTFDLPLSPPFDLLFSLFLFLLVLGFHILLARLLEFYFSIFGYLNEPLKFLHKYLTE